MNRLRTFFDVETRIKDRVPTGDDLVDWLHGKAGVIADTRFSFDARLVRSLPTLKAICNLDAGQHNFDLQALTRAGIRATCAPAPGSVQQSQEAAADQTWLQLQAMLQRAAPVAGAEGRYINRWSRKVLLNQPAHMLVVGIIGAGPMVEALAARLQAAQVRLFDARAVSRQDNFWRSADVVVVCVSRKGTKPCITAADMTLLKPAARILNLAGAGALAADIVREPQLMSRVDNSVSALVPLTAESGTLASQSSVAAESLIASLGFGRNSWHPAHLLNPDVLCESCC